MTTVGQGFELTVERTVQADRERVFAAFTEPDRLKKWFAPEGMGIPNVEVDLEVGGRWTVSMAAADGSAVHTAVGTYREIDPPNRLVTTWAWLGEDGQPGPETRITVELEETDGGTRVVMHHRGFDSEEFRDQHRSGWQSTFTRMEAGIG